MDGKSGMNTKNDGWAIAVFLLAVAFPAIAADKPAPQPLLVIEKDTELDPAKTYSRIIINASNITIDGKGASIVGATEGDPKAFQGTGISADGVSGVTLKNVKVKGWEIGLTVKNAESGPSRDATSPATSTIPNSAGGRTAAAAGFC